MPAVKRTTHRGGQPYVGSKPVEGITCRRERARIPSQDRHLTWTSSRSRAVNLFRCQGTRRMHRVFAATAPALPDRSRRRRDLVGPRNIRKGFLRQAERHRIYRCSVRDAPSGTGPSPPRRLGEADGDCLPVRATRLSEMVDLPPVPGPLLITRLPADVAAPRAALRVTRAVVAVLHFLAPIARCSGRRNRGDNGADRQ